jgi:hypothetical protein
MIMSGRNLTTMCKYCSRCNTKLEVFWDDSPDIEEACDNCFRMLWNERLVSMPVFLEDDYSEDYAKSTPIDWEKE